MGVAWGHSIDRREKIQSTGGDQRPLESRPSHSADKKNLTKNVKKINFQETYKDLKRTCRREKV